MGKPWMILLKENWRFKLDIRDSWKEIRATNEYLYALIYNDRIVNRHSTKMTLGEFLIDGSQFIAAAGSST